MWVEFLVSSCFVCILFRASQNKLYYSALLSVDMDGVAKENSDLHAICTTQTTHGIAGSAREATCGPVYREWVAACHQLGRLPLPACAGAAPPLLQRRP